MKRDWTLVLDARNIPFVISAFRGVQHLYVPPLLENTARDELAAYARENAPVAKQPFKFSIHKHCWFASLFILPILLWYGMGVGWWPVPANWPAPDTWQSIGELNYFQIKFHHQWYRLATALTLHSGLPHIFGNLVFGSIFLAFLARLSGYGHAFLLSILGGIAGNFFSVLFHDPGYRSIGFSTALFATIGVMAGMMLWQLDSRRRFLAPVACACAMLALLGTEGQTTDYGAHLAGLFCGIFLGIGEGWAIRKNFRLLPQCLAGMIGLLLLAGAWCCAFSQV